MTEPSEDRDRDDPAGPLNRPAYGGVLAQGPVRPDGIVTLIKYRPNLALLSAAKRLKMHMATISE